MQTIITQLAKHSGDVYFGGNWTSVNLQHLLQDINWQQATTKIHSLNTIATLVFHINYYVNPVLKVLQGEPLVASDKYSFDAPTITCEEDWQMLITKTMTDARRLADAMEKLSEEKLFENFTDAKYGTYYRNLVGIIEHTHYHMGQISLLKKILTEE